MWHLPHWHNPGTTDRAADSQRTVRFDAWGSFLQTDALACGKVLRYPPDRRAFKPNRFYDIDTVNTSLSNDLVQFFDEYYYYSGSFGHDDQDHSSSGAGFCSYGSAVGAVYSFYDQPGTPPVSQCSKCLGALNGFAEEYISGQKTIRASPSGGGCADTF